MSNSLLGDLQVRLQTTREEVFRGKPIFGRRLLDQLVAPLRNSQRLDAVHKTTFRRQEPLNKTLLIFLSRAIFRCHVQNFTVACFRI